ncbi:hypothetical protein PCANC_01420 [Puccinia coronata f. sp. avenae]|uniref:GATA-type domain-containing protein n=1 Tax=Puccinia coronata f. sp. avenae TaxID=200324 RepID=A0A2N5W677_9BASI|nr:hypothetical protein PCANC_01420 [Puccinia coronata f. sp. avenae]
MHQQSSDFSSSSSTNNNNNNHNHNNSTSSNHTSNHNNHTNQSHSPLSHLNSPSDPSSDLANWRSGFGNGRFTVDSGVALYLSIQPLNLNPLPGNDLFPLSLLVGSSKHHEPAPQDFHPTSSSYQSLLTHQIANCSPFSPSSPYSPWSPSIPAHETPLHDYRCSTSLPNTRDPFAAHLWQLYGPRDERTPTNDTLENLVPRLTELGLDVNQIRQTLNSHDWKDVGIPSHFSASTCSPDTLGPTTSTSELTNHRNDGSPETSQRPSNKPSQACMRSTPQPSRLSKIEENGEEHTGKFDLLRSPLIIREPSLERGRRNDGCRRGPCNLAGRWQECTNHNRSPAVADMDWKADSRSRSRTHSDWRQTSRSRSRLQEFRPDLLAAGHQFDGDSLQRFKSAVASPGPFEPPPSSLFPELSNQQQNSGPSGTSGTSNSNEAYHHGLIQQLIGSYQAQQSEEIGLQSLAQKCADPVNLEPSGSLATSCGLFQYPSSVPLGEFDMGSWHLPIKPSQHSLLGSIPGLTQDFADLANAHAEYGYIPRLVRKTSFDEILAQQHHPKRAAESGERSPTRLDNHSGLTAESMVRPNTATDTREGQYRMGLDASVFDKQSQTSTSNESNGQPDYFDLLNSIVTQGDSTNESEFKNHFQSPRLSSNSNSNSSDDLFFQGTENTFQPFFEADGSSIVDRITPYDILAPFDHFDNTPIAHNPRNQWLQQGSVAPTAVQSSPVESTKKSEVNRLVSSPSSTSSSSESSSRGGLALQINTANAHSKMSHELSAGEAPTKISFSGGRSNHTSSIGEARKRTKQLPYSSGGDLGNNSSNPSSSSNGQSNNNNVTQCLNCQTTETPLWRRDSEGRPLCNACGLFVNLHGTPRPAALSTGIIKRRNRGKNREKLANMANSNNNKSAFAPAKPVLNPLIHTSFPHHSTDQSGQPRPNDSHYTPQPTPL